MSEWGSSYNENYNYNQNSYSYHQGNGSNRSFEGMSNARTSHNTDYTGAHSTRQDSMMFIANGGGMYTSDATYGNSEYQQPRSTQSRTSHHNVELSSDILNRAANSQLTATAGEFFPRSYNSHAQGNTYFFN